MNVTKMISVLAHIPISEHFRTVLSPNELIILCAVAHYKGVDGFTVAENVKAYPRTFMQRLRVLHRQGYLVVKHKSIRTGRAAPFYSLSTKGAEMCSQMLSGAIKANTKQ